MTRVEVASKIEEYITNQLETRRFLEQLVDSEAAVFLGLHSIYSGEITSIQERIEVLKLVRDSMRKLGTRAHRIVSEMIHFLETDSLPTE